MVASMVCASPTAFSDTWPYCFRPFGGLRFGCVAALLVSLVAGCAQLPASRSSASASHDLAQLDPTAAQEQIRKLGEDLAGLADSVHPREAETAAACAVQSVRELAAKYHLVRPPLLHNTLVNLGFRERGLCYQFAEDMLARLQALKLETLQLRWAMARPGTWREHNAIVLTARGQAFEKGILLDGWRKSGRLVWQVVEADRYPWQEGELDAPVPSP